MSKMSNLALVLDKVKEQMCDEYCKYPYEYRDNEILDAVCDRCPLCRIDAVQTYPDNDGGYWYYHPRTGEMVIVRD